MVKIFSDAPAKGGDMYSDAYPFKMLFGGAVKQIKVGMKTVGNDDFVLAGANPSADAEEEDNEVVVEQILDILEAFNNLEDMTDMYRKIEKTFSESNFAIKIFLDIFF